jgi:Zn-dependent peptidase ImmA (M78 family)
MTKLSTLYRRAEELNIPVLFLDLPRIGSVSVMDEDGNCAIGMDYPHRRSKAEQRVRLAHELGHCVTGSFYNRYSPWDLRRAHENRADKYAVTELISPEDLDEAVAQGHTELWDLADFFGVDEAFLKKAVCLYTYGNLAAELYF